MPISGRRPARRQRAVYRSGQDSHEWALGDVSATGNTDAGRRVTANPVPPTLAAAGTTVLGNGITAVAAIHLTALFS